MSLNPGYAHAVLPLAAAAIHTDTDGLTAGEVSIAVREGEIPGYRAKPARAGKFAVVLVIEEIFGVHEHIQDVCRRLAKEGYFAIAPELFARQGDISKMTDIQEILSKVVSQIPDAQVMADLDDTVAWTARDETADMSRLGMTGFCWGGRVVWLYAAHSSMLRAGAAWYGQLAQKDEKRPKSAIEAAAELKAPVIGLYGGKDHGIPLAQVEQMRDALQQAGKPSEIHVYPDAGHAFNADFRPSYHEASAKDAWGKMLAWFRRYGVI